MTSPGELLPPEPPGRVSAELTPSNEALIAWTAPAPADNRAPVTGYLVYRQFADGSEPELLHQTEALSYRHAGLSPGTRYVFFVRANSARGPSPPSASAYVDVPSAPLVPLAVPQVTVRADEGPDVVVISWVHHQNPEHVTAVAGFRLQYCEVNSDHTTDHCARDHGWRNSTLLPLGPGVGSHRDEFECDRDGGNRQARMYRVQALAGEPSASSRFSVPTRPVCPGDYSPPRRVDAVFPRNPQESDVALCWQAPEDNGSPVTGYELQVTPDETLPVTDDGWRIVDAHIPPDRDGDGHADDPACHLYSGLARRDRRWFRVRAYNLAGHGHWSAPYAYVHEPSVVPPSALARSSTQDQATVTIADARTREGTDAALVFAVTLDRPAPGPVSVEYATADETATAGEDYRATSGTLVFAPGETAGSIGIAVLDDAADEGEETLTVRLRNPAGASIADAEATGTIVDDAALPRAWLARFGRSVAGQVVAAVGARLERTGGSHVTVAGMPIRFAGQSTLPETPDPPGPEPARDVWTESPGEKGSLAGRELLRGSAFHLVTPHDGPALAAWGRIAVESFETDVDDGRMDGEVATGVAGADVEGDGWLAGVAFSHSEADAQHVRGSAMPPERGHSAIESTMTGAYPYARVRLSDRISLWGLAGAGQGTLVLDEDGATPVETDIRMTIAAIGAYGMVLAPAEAAGFELAVRSDAFWTRTSSDAVRSERGAGLADTRADANRLRIAMVGARAFALGADATLTPSVEVGVRHDGADAETGHGFDVGAGLRYAGEGITAEGEVRTLVAHDDGGYEAWGASGSLHIDPGASERGLSLTLVPVLGQARGGANRLWSPADLRRLAGDAAGGSAPRLEAEIGYGMGLESTPGVLTPFAGLVLSDAGARSWRLGARLRMGPDFTLNLGGSRRAGRGRAPDQSVTLRGALRW